MDFDIAPCSPNGSRGKADVFVQCRACPLCTARKTPGWLLTQSCTSGHVQPMPHGELRPIRVVRIHGDAGCGPGRTARAGVWPRGRSGSSFVFQHGFDERDGDGALVCCMAKRSRCSSNCIRLLRSRENRVEHEGHHLVRQVHAALVGSTGATRRGARFSASMCATGTPGPSPAGCASLHARARSAGGSSHRRPIPSGHGPGRVFAHSQTS
jgi:hypothetical protein